MAERAFLYVIGAAAGPNKLGVSGNPRRRLGQLQVGSSLPLFLKRAAPVEVSSAMAVETYAHWLLRESRVRGEWFDVSDDAAWAALTAAFEATDAGDEVPKGSRVAGRKERLPDVMTVRFADGTFERIDAVAGENRRAAFVRAAVERELAAPTAAAGPSLDAAEAFRAIRTLAQVAIDADGGAGAATTLRSILTACEKAMPDRPRRPARKPKPPTPDTP